MALFNITNGYAWINYTGWGTDIPHCDWYGVTCNEDEHVTILDLDQNALTGTLLAEIGDLPMLTILRLTGTAVWGKGGCEYYRIGEPIPPEFGNLASLTYLDLHNNQLSGTIPAFFSNLHICGYLFSGKTQA